MDNYTDFESIDELIQSSGFPVKRRRRTHAQQAAGHPRRRRMKPEPG